VKSIEKADPKDFLADAWELIESAREHVMRPQTDLEYLIEQGSPRDALAAIFGRRDRERMILFARLCDPNRNKGDTEMIKLPDAESEKTIEVEWKVYCSERGFDDLFLAYWRDLGEQWTEWMKGEKPRALWMKKDAVTFWKLAHNKEKYPGGFKQLWKERGQSVLASWKRDGVPRGHFLALASGYFERGVKVITGQDRLDRALPWFRRFLNSDFANEDKAERAMAEYREKGFAPRELYSLKNAFAKWRTGEVSRKRSEARAKRGRVRSKNDKRLGARLPGSI
jgi:hypothetical protein